MANEKNLIPIECLSSEEAKRRGSNGGKASAEARRRKKTLKQTLQAALALPVSNTDAWNKLSAFGINPENIDNQNAIVVAMVIEAMSGNVQAFNAIRNLLGEDTASEDIKVKQKAIKLKEKESKVNAPTADTEQPKLYEALEASDDDI